MSKMVDSNKLAKLAAELDRRMKVEVQSEQERARIAEDVLQQNIDAVEDMFGGKSLRYVTQEEYDALSDDEKNDANIVWNITDAPEVYQTLKDENLNTEDKTIVGAINELKTNKADKMIYTYRKKEFDKIVSTSTTYPKSDYEFEGRMEFVVGRLYRIEMHNSNGDIFTFDCVSEEMTTAAGDISKGLKVSGNVMTEGQWYVDEAVDVNNTNRNYSNLILSIMGFNTVPIAQYPMEKIIISEIEEVTTEFFELNKTITEDERTYWNNKQDKEDENLNTEDKTIVGAINELELEVFEAKADIIALDTYKQDKEDENLNTENKTIVGAINEVNELIPCYDTRVFERRTYTLTNPSAEVSSNFPYEKVSDDVYTIEELESSKNFKFIYKASQTYEVEYILEDDYLIYNPEDSPQIIYLYGQAAAIITEEFDGIQPGFYLFNLTSIGNYYSEISFDYVIQGELKALNTDFLRNSPGRKTAEGGEIFNDYSDNIAELYSHAEGYSCWATEQMAHAEGYYTKANGFASHAEGCESIANGDKSHAEGCGCVTNAESAHAEGCHTIASSICQHVEGRGNIEDKNQKYLHIVGNGYADARSNAHTLDWAGNAWFAGDVTIGVNNKKLATETYVTDVIKENLITKTIAENKVTLTTDKRQKVEMIDGTEIVLPSVTDFTEIHLYFSTLTDLTLIFPAGKYQKTPEIKANKTYEFIFTYVGEWLIGYIEYGN